MKPYFSRIQSIYCSGLSAFGIVFLLVLGSLIKQGNHVLTQGKEPIEDTENAANNCFIAAAVYAFFLVFCSWQSWLNAKVAREEELAERSTSSASDYIPPIGATSSTTAGYNAQKMNPQSSSSMARPRLQKEGKLFPFDFTSNFSSLVSGGRA
ncbi:hypothetical protein MP228_013007 [Amoeboaphelidium protococcarum]|nr:hypothetical protein MP228_013007 [Amoeboaphelidium protococcarum]